MQRIVASRPVAGGYTNARRSLVRFEDGSTAFLKEAVDADTAAWLRQERRVYEALRADFLPRLLEWREEPPALLLEDLSGAAWPPPWTRERVDGVVALLRRLRDLEPPPGLPRLADSRDLFRGWSRVAEDPGPFLSLGFCGAAWLESSLPVLRRAEEAAPLDGDRLVHLDVRSDNLCFADRVVLVDWNWASRGNPDFDLAFWAPSLHAEGGPPPESLLPRAPELAAAVSGFFAAAAGLPVIPVAPRVREVQRFQLATALPWVARALGLSAPG